MHPVLQKTFGGLTRQYYLRHLFFALLIAVFLCFISLFSRDIVSPLSMVLLIIINTPLYPYSRFVYESVVDFIMGNKVFALNALLMSLANIISIVMCWLLTIFTAPIGLLYLYFYHSKAERYE